MGIPRQPHPRGTLLVDGQTLPRETSPLCGQTLTLVHHHGSLLGNGQTILSVGGHTSTSGRHSRPDRVGDQTVSDNGRTITLVPHFVPNPVIGQTVSSVCGRTPTSGCHFPPDHDEGQTILYVRGQTPTSVR